MVGRLFQNSNVIFSFKLQYIHSRCIYSIHSRPAIVIQDFNAFKSTIIIQDIMHAYTVIKTQHLRDVLCLMLKTRRSATNP